MKKTSLVGAFITGFLAAVAVLEPGAGSFWFAALMAGLATIAVYNVRV